ncbi:glycoside hydrolase family 30 beta sandwich domain-containing protein [Spirosoma rigui]|uniref:glycoside hydrolase family 30 beta sandwich domain-containing protein n=1 Tax=Spirosoma rigui TaxID=564064 RepID=UPI0009B105C9|nr:glycoside hydrolase family 30 beta sandwich domain-containing protein [Spirosoma rigui]
MGTCFDNGLVSSFRNRDQKLVTMIINKSNDAVVIEPVLSKQKGRFTIAAKSITTPVSACKK